jgi:hypothetical protein
MKFAFYTPSTKGKMKLYGNADNIPQANILHNELKNAKKSYRVITTYPDGVQCVSEYIN